MPYGMNRTEEVLRGCSSGKERDRWYFLDSDEYPKLFNERILEHLYDCGSLTLEELQKKEIDLKDIALDNIKAEIKFGSIESYKENGVTKYRLTEIGKGIVEMQKESEAAWQTEKQFRRKLELE